MAGRSWCVPALLAVLAIAAISTIVTASLDAKAKEPAPLPEAPSHVVTTMSRGAGTALRIHVGEYLRLDLPGGSSYSTVVEQPGTDKSVVTDLKLPGQQPQLRADTTGHAIVEVMSEPVCPSSESCPAVRTLVGMLDVTVTP
jgi:hypothetical protein